MANIRLDLSSPPYDGQSVTFISPIDCSNISGLKIYYYQSNGEQTSQVFTLTDAHGNNVAGIELFKSNVLVRVVLHTSSMKAYVQNADTNAYLEGKFKSYDSKLKNLEDNMGNHTHPASKITEGTFGGQVVAHKSSQTPSMYLVRNQKLSATAEVPTVEGEICWVYR